MVRQSDILHGADASDVRAPTCVSRPREARLEEVALTGSSVGGA